jgi:hypothetical protein
MSGTLAALDIVFLHDQDVIASEILGATDIDALLAVAKEEEYLYLDKLLAIATNSTSSITKEILC